MRLATLSHEGTSRAAVLDPSEAYLLPLPLAELIRLGLDRALEIGDRARREEPIAWDESQLLLPYRPPSIRDFVTFESHVEGVRKSIDGTPGIPEAWYDAPHFYFTNPHALFGPGAAVPRPESCRDLDFELEVAVVLGNGGSSLTAAEAESTIFGFTILNDWSARDIQSREMKAGLGPAKGKDFATSFGPWIVTADEVGPPGGLDLECRAYVNDELIGVDRLSSMHWTFPQMIVHASRDSVVVPGDLLASGTTGGGCLAEFWGRRGNKTPPPLEPGDVVRLEVDGLGALTGSVTGHLDERESH